MALKKITTVDAAESVSSSANLYVEDSGAFKRITPAQAKGLLGVDELKNAISEFIYTEPTLPPPDKAWIRYSNGERVGSSATRLFVFNASGIKRIKAFLTSDTPVLCAIAFYTSDGISTSGYMASDSVDFLSGIHNDGAWYETPVPDGCITIAITSKVPSASVAEYKILFAKDYATKSDITALSSDISELNTDITEIRSENFTPNTFDDLEWYRASYIRYSDGARIGSGTYLRTYYFSNNGIGRRVKATLYCGDTIPAIIAFYSTETLDTNGYLKAESVQAKAGWATYEADIPAECKLIVFTHRNDYTAGSGEPSIQFLGSDIALNAYLSLATAVQTGENAVATASGVKSLALSRVLNALSKPCYDHLFVNELGDSIVIPHESVYHVRLSKAFGFDMIEANVAPTSDGVYVVNHLISGKFGGYFHHVDGTTDISDIALNTVTWAWVQENVRYNSQIPKYRTRPCRLEEFLAECKANNLIPFLGRSGDANVVAIADHIMGKGQYVAYDGGRTTCPDGVLYSFKSDLTTKEDILNYCETKGKPFAYGLGNVNSFTDAQLQEIVDLLHANGYWIGVSYADSKWYKYAEMGFDFNGTQRLMNRIECGNLHNISSIFGFGGYTITGATEADGVLTFSEAGNIWPRVDNTTYNVCAIDLEMVFSGGITLYPIGEMKYATGYNSDGSKSVFVTIPIINGSPYFHIVAAAGTIFYDLNYKASVLA